MAHAKRNTATRFLIAIALVTLAALSLPARAAAAPVLFGTSVDGGFGSYGPIAARFDQTLDAASIATMKDKNGLDVPGSTILSTSTGNRKDSLIFTPAPKAGEPLAEALSPYTITFAAQGAVDGSGVTEAVKSFKFDLGRPSVSVSSATGGLYLPGDKIDVVGGATDPLNSRVDPVTRVDSGIPFRSGLTSRVEVQFYNLLNNPSTSGTVEVRGLRQYPVLAACTSADTAGCEQQGVDAAWSVDTSKLTTGQWTLKIYASDVAGNRSLASTVEFTKIG